MERLTMFTILLIPFVAGVAVREPSETERTCAADADCQAGECCVLPIEGPVILSKRDVAEVQPGILDILGHQDDSGPQGEGTCRPYRQSGQYCYPFARMEGGCGCAPNLQCNYEPNRHPGMESFRYKRMVMGPSFCRPVAPMPSKK